MPMKLKKYIKDKGLTNSEVCRKAEIGEATLSQFLNNKRGINFETACKISKALGISTDQLKKLSEEGKENEGNCNN